MKTFLFLLFIFICSCGGHKNVKTELNIKKNDFHSIEFVTLLQSSLHGNGKEKIKAGLYIIKNKNAWKELLIKMNVVNKEITKKNIININFDNQMLLAVFDPVLGNGGVKIYIDKIIETPKKIKVFVKHIYPKGFYTMVMSQPYHVIVLSKKNKEVELIQK